MFKKVFFMIAVVSTTLGCQTSSIESDRLPAQDNKGNGQTGAVVEACSALIQDSNGGPLSQRNYYIGKCVGLATKHKLSSDDISNSGCSSILPVFGAKPAAGFNCLVERFNLADSNATQSNSESKEMTCTVESYVGLQQVISNSIKKYTYVKRDGQVKYNIGDRFVMHFSAANDEQWIMPMWTLYTSDGKQIFSGGGRGLGIFEEKLSVDPKTGASFDYVCGF